MLCRLAQDGIRTAWTPIKMRDVLAKMSPDMAENIDTLADGNFFGENSDEGNGSEEKKRRALRAALHGYAASLAAEHGQRLAPADFLAIGNIAERYQASFETTTGMKEGFDTVAALYALSFGMELDPGAEKKRRREALDEAGLSLTGELVSSDEPSDVVPSEPAHADYVLDTEFIAIYW